MVFRRIFLLEKLTTSIDYLERFYKSFLNVADSVSTVRNVVSAVHGVHDYKWIIEGPLTRVFAEDDLVTYKIVQMWLEPASIKMEEARQIFTHGLKVVLVEHFQVS